MGGWRNNSSHRSSRCHEEGKEGNAYYDGASPGRLGGTSVKIEQRLGRNQIN
jgi:hypothetical protein